MGFQQPDHHPKWLMIHGLLGDFPMKAECAG